MGCLKIGIALVWIAIAPTTSRAQQQPPPQKATLGGSPRVSPDGSRILIVSDRSGTDQLYSMHVDGTDVKQLTSDSAGAHSASWSPDGRRIVHVSGTQVVVINADGAGRRVISDAKGNQTPSWSPDGGSILLAGGNFPNIMIQAMNADGSSRRIVAPNAAGGFDYDPVWSPDGRSIAFVSGIRGQGPRIHVMNADGTGRRRLTTLSFGEERPMWSPDGKQIAFQASGELNGVSDANIYVTTVSSGDTRRITNHRRPMLDETPSWFPDGQRLAIQSDRDGTWSTYVIGLDGAVKARLTKPAHYYNPKWSPDGGSLAFESTREGTSAVYTVRIDGTRLFRLTGDTMGSGQPNWSPDGKRIVFSAEGGGRGGLFLVSADGSGMRRLTTTTGGEYGASFSADGSWIVFQGRPDNALVNERVYVVRPDGSGRRELTPDTLNSVGPRWTKDGRITFTQSRYGVLRWNQMTEQEMERGRRSEVVITVNPDGSGLTRSPKPAAVVDSVAVRLGGDAGEVPEPNASPDGRLLAYERNAGQRWGIYVYDLAARTERAVVGGRAQPIK
jgi:Tol biopolymer transport system component